VSESTQRSTTPKAPRSAKSEPVTGGMPAQQRALRAQGRRTMRKLLDAGMKTFAERGFYAARVDDVVRAARTSHGTFYLYFTNKEDLLRALAVDCAAAMNALADDIGPIGPDAAGYVELRRALGSYLVTYTRYGPVIRAWMEGQVADREIDRMGIKAFTAVASALAARMAEGFPTPGVNPDVGAGALMAMLERFTYAASSRRLGLEPDAALDTLTRVVHRGFFGAGLSIEVPQTS
jgi:AcrR family transcriptional regulator